MKYRLEINRPGTKTPYPHGIRNIVVYRDGTEVGVMYHYRKRGSNPPVYVRTWDGDPQVTVPKGHLDAIWYAACDTKDTACTVDV